MTKNVTVVKDPCCEGETFKEVLCPGCELTYDWEVCGEHNGREYCVKCYMAIVK